MNRNQSLPDADFRWGLISKVGRETLDAPLKTDGKEWLRTGSKLEGEPSTTNHPKKCGDRKRAINVPSRPRDEESQ